MGVQLRWVLLLLLVIAPAVALAADPPADVIFEKDIVYGKGGGTDLKLNLSRPKDPGSTRLRCVVVIHGGG